MYVEVIYQFLNTKRSWKNTRCGVFLTSLEMFENVPDHIVSWVLMHLHKTKTKKEKTYARAQMVKNCLNRQATQVKCPFEFAFFSFYSYITIEKFHANGIISVWPIETTTTGKKSILTSTRINRSLYSLKQNTHLKNSPLYVFLAKVSEPARTASQCTQWEDNKTRPIVRKLAAKESNGVSKTKAVHIYMLPI